MSDLMGYLSSFFVTFSLASGFIFAAALFVFLIGYGLTLFFRKTRGLFKEEPPVLRPAGNRIIQFRSGNTKDTTSHDHAS